MTPAGHIVQRLLEADIDDDAKAELLNTASEREAREAQGEITAINALTAQHFYHRKLKYKTRNEPIMARRNGRTKTWVTRPGEFRIPVKYGMYDTFYIDHTNAHEWSTTPVPVKEGPSA